MGALLAPRFFCEFVAQNFCAQFAGFIAGNPGDGYHRRGGIPLQLKMWILSGTAIALWLTPLVALDKKVTWHKAIQGLSLGGAVACAIGAGNIARRLAEESEIEAMKARAIKEDTEDEIATEVYVAQKQRQQEAEQLLNPVEHLERALALTRDDDEHSECSENKESNQLAKIDSERSVNTENERTDRILELRAKGWGKLKIILEIWGLTRGGGAKYKAAEAEYKRLVEGNRESEE